jgi:NAD(P)-dependent dehydrogenase (short-subunit alcohol dehydrogenase family)
MTPTLVKTALITGANRGLGLELAHALYGMGYSLIMHSRIVHINECVEWDDVACVFGDLRDDETIERIRDLVNGKPLDALINNAGIYYDVDFPFMDPAMLEDVLDVDLLAPMKLTQVLWFSLAKAKGVVVNINSLAGITPGHGETAYGAAKCGLRGFSEAVQYEAAREKVRVVNVALGGLKTGMTRHRKDHDKMIDPVEAANFIASLCRADYGTMRITNVELKRRIY